MVFKTALLGILLVATGADSKPEAPAADKGAIRGHCGCFEVTYQFAETASLAPGYKIKPPKRIGGLEWIEVDGERPDAVYLQHVLVVPDGAQKHWRQEWTYEPEDLFDFKGDGVWQKRRLTKREAQGKWVQRVYEVDDSPRYEGLGPWVHADGRHYWEAESWSPLPRREFTTRSDYNVLDRYNRQQLTDTGWVHVQENMKLIVEETRGTPLAMEKGLNTYRRVEDARCETARRWWQENKATWHQVQDVWHEIYQQSDRIHLLKEKDGVPLWQRVFSLTESKVTDAAKLKADVRQAIHDYEVK
jgi:hypothetical protein